MKKLMAVAVSCVLILTMVPGFAGAAPLWDFSYTGTIAHGNGGALLESPRGVCVDKFGNTYVVSHEQDLLDIYDETGYLVDTWIMSGGGDGEINDPVDVEVDRWGKVYILEKGNQRISVFNGHPTIPSEPNGQFLRHISGPGPSVAHLSDPFGIGVSLDGYVYVTDGFHSVKKFDNFDNFIDKWTPAGNVRGLSCDQDGNVWTANDHKDTHAADHSNTITKYSSDGTLLGSWGETGTADGYFDRTYDVDVDAGGRFYALDSMGERVQAFAGDGTFLTKYTGTGATPSSFWWPYGVAAGHQREFRVADTSFDRVVSFEASPAIPTDYTGVSGANRYETAAKASQLGRSEATTIVVATGMNWPDALSGATLAGAADAPLLLTNPSALSAEIDAEIARLGATDAYVLGGPAAVSGDVYDELETILGPSNVHRLGGADRYETSVLIAEQALSQMGGHDGTVIIATGANFPDALAVSPIAAANEWPILLTEPDELPAVIADALTDNALNHGYLVGGEGAVSADVEDALEAHWTGMGVPFPPLRYAGDNRYETAAVIAEAGFTGLGMMYSRPALATGENFPDALAGGVLQGSDYCVMLLTPSGSLHPDAAAALMAHKDSIYEVRYLGGTSAVSAAVRTSTQALLH